MSRKRSCCCNDRTVIVSPWRNTGCCRRSSCGFGNSWIIWIIILCCFCGNNGFGNNCGNNCGNDGCGFGCGNNSCWWIIILLLLCCCCDGNRW